MNGGNGYPLSVIGYQGGRGTSILVFGYPVESSHKKYIEAPLTP